VTLPVLPGRLVPRSWSSDVGACGVLSACRRNSGWRCVTFRTPIGELLVAGGYIDRAQLTSGLDHQQRWGGRLGEALVVLRFVSQPVLLGEVARQHRVRYLHIGERVVPPLVLRILPEKFIRVRRVLPVGFVPIRKGRSLLFLATTEPQNLAVLDEVAFITEMKVTAKLVGDADLDRAIERHLGPAAGAVAISRAVPGPNDKRSERNGVRRRDCRHLS